MRTDLDGEREEQRRWRLKPRHAGVRTFDELVENEFLSEDEQAARQSAALTRVMRHAAEAVPYYRDLFGSRRLRAEDIRAAADLPKLPLLDKVLVRTHDKRLRARKLPKGERVYGVFASSGTTGQPTRVVQTVSSSAMFAYLSQRSYRWFRLDPMKTLAFFRASFALPRQADGRTYPDGETCRLPQWRYVGRFFETGPWLGMTMTTPVADQLAWLRAERPAYLGAHASWLEQLTYASGRRAPADGLQGVIAIVEQMPPSMRRRIERVFAAPAHQNYGLNEIGLVAARCAAGRYHVHAEHCLVEIVDDDGQPCPPGETGRIAVTALKNPAMPLIRYDTDDMAEAATGPCPCGRTLPAFTGLIGRYRRHLSLPAGSYALFLALREAVGEIPDEVARNMRQFQVHQFRDNRFELRLATTGPLPAAFYERVRAAWRTVIGERDETLAFVEVDDLPRGANGKFQDFTSDYMPAPEAEAPAGAGDGEPG